ncbi:hypothetical protein DRH14_00445 [Candidatus Shapirobacteria bacterium]|nr:MAG: hypothetical protein DRH14_00445 [Candidatus Shapirobacteria bacterium]
MKDVLILNSPSRDYGFDPRSEGERVLTPYGVGLVAMDSIRELGYDRVSFVDTEFAGLSIEDILDRISVET